MKLPFLSKAASTEKQYDSEHYIPVIRCSICTGEQVAGFKEKSTGRIEDIMLIRDEHDLKIFCKRYAITQPIEKVY